MTDSETTGTGDRAIDEALEPLTGLADLPVDKHPAVFDAIHAQLRSALTDPREPQ